MALKRIVATVPNGPPDPPDAETNWRQHASGITKYNPPVLPIAPATFAAAVRLSLGSAMEPECDNFSASLQNTTWIFGQTPAPSGAGTSHGLLGYMFWKRKVRPPATCENGVGAGSDLAIPMPPPRQQ